MSSRSPCPRRRDDGLYVVVAVVVVLFVFPSACWVRVQGERTDAFVRPVVVKRRTSRQERELERMCM